MAVKIEGEQLKRLQAVELELISEVDRICRKCGIHYNMVGGTMLGAIRHRGPIPWDDDADIGFLREEYEKFREACRTELDHDRFYMQDFRDTKGYRWGYGKLRRKGTAFIRQDQEYMPYEQGVFIDLMPFDNVPDGWISRRLHFAECFLFRKLFWSKVGAKTEENPVYRQIYRLMSHIPENRVKKAYEAFIQRGRHKKTRLVRILTFPTPKHCFGYMRKWYTELCRYDFSGVRFPGAKDYDGYLSVKYGNYMELPPVEKRKTHPVSKLVLPGDEKI
ncbi:MAG: LicD family protein [Lachnospiraceae bacterium]|nr:LicD family protein [Lachnospiraceae bacterium]